jgi:cyclophilin family peptidyl-prolyl cis-trans isomerase
MKGRLGNESFCGLTSPGSLRSPPSPWKGEGNTQQRKYIAMTKSSRWSTLLGVTMWAMVVACGTTWGQDDAANGDAAQQYAQAKAAWEKLEKDVAAVVAKFRESEESERAALRKEYETLVAKSDGVLKGLREAAVAAYQAAPGKDADVEKTLVRMAADDVRRDDYEAALAIAKPMIDNDTQNKDIFNYAGIAAYGVDDFAHAEKWLQKADAQGTLNGQGQICLEDAAAAQERFAKEQKIREEEKAKDDLPRVKLKTNRGDIVIELFENEAPETVGNFVSLVESGFYDGLTFHRVLPGFMAQGGDPDGTGGGGPGYEIYCECHKPEHREHFRGTLSMAHAGKDTGGSQFFLTFRSTPHLDGLHTAFGRVIEGFDVLAKLQRRNPQALNPPAADKIVKAEVIRKRDHKYEPHKVE